MKNFSKLLLVLAATSLLASCTPSSPSNQGAGDSGEAASQGTPSSTSVDLQTSSSEAPVDLSGLNIETANGTYEETSTGISITSYGVYTFSGELEGQISIDIAETEEGESEVELDLNGVSIHYAGNSPIYATSCDKLKIKAMENTSNEIKDERAVESVEDESQGGGAIYAKVDTSFVGKGSLNVIGTYNNGIHVTKDLKIKNETLQVTAPNNAIKGNNSITVESGTITAISSGGDGLKSTDSDVSSKGNQKGNISIEGGTVNIYSYADGIDAAYNAEISGGTLNIVTNKYSSYSGDSPATSSSTMYLRSTTAYSSNYRYACLFNNGSNTVWADAKYKTSISSGGGDIGRRGLGGGGAGGGTTYYYYELSKPSGYGYFTLYKFASSVADSTSSYAAKSESYAVNSNYDTATFSGSTSLSISGWTNYSSQSQGGGFSPTGGQSEGNTDKASDSAKGIKGHNEVNISGGDITIKAYDDGIHATYGETLENGEAGAGDVSISGGTLSIYASDDGIHADRYLKMSGGNTNVTYSYEGLEGNVIEYSGGSARVSASDDGVNSNSGDDQDDGTPGPHLSSQIIVSGGTLDVNVSPNGDTDGIDSNGSYKQTGGTVITKGPSSTNMAALDTESGVTISGGTLVSFGKIASTPKASNVTYSSKSGSYSGTKTLTYANGTTLSTTLDYTYSGCTSYSINGTLNSIS